MVGPDRTVPHCIVPSDSYKQFPRESASDSLVQLLAGTNHRLNPTPRKLEADDFDLKQGRGRLKADDESAPDPRQLRVLYAAVLLDSSAA